MNKHPEQKELSAKQMKGFGAAVARNLPLPAADTAQFWIDNGDILQLRLKTLGSRPINLFWWTIDHETVPLWTFEKLQNEGLVRNLHPHAGWYDGNEPEKPYDHIDLVIVSWYSESKIHIAQRALNAGAELIVICLREDHARIHELLGRSFNVHFWVESNLDRFEWFLREHVARIQKTIS